MAVFVIGCLCAGPTMALGQSGIGTGTIDGTVVDSDKAAMPGVTVEVRDQSTGLTRQAVTDARGRFSLIALSPGVYALEGTLAGFAPVRRDQVAVTVGDTVTLSLTMTVAGVTETVAVTARVSGLDTRGAATASFVNERAIQELPVRGRNFAEFVQLTPGVVQEGDRFGLVMGGQRSINSNVSIDGVDFNDPLQGNQRGGNESAFFFPQAAIREFQVVRSGAGAETGRTSAGLVNVVTKSGTNTVNGETFYLNRNKALTSPDAFDRKLNNQQNQFGGAAGGPIRANRAFYFAAVEQNFLRVPFVVKFQPQAAGVTVPAALRALEGEQFGTNNPTAVFLKTDWVLGTRSRLEAQYTYARLRGDNFNFDSPQLDTATTANFRRETQSHAGKVSLNTVARPSVVNELRLQYATDDRTETPNSLLPQITINGFGTIGGDSGRPRFFEARRLQVTDSLTLVRGRHTVRIGGDVNITPSRQQRESNIIGRYDFTSLANYNAGVIARYRQTLPTFDLQELFYDATQKEAAAYIQDAFTVNSRLTLNAGFRWEGQWNPDPPRPNPAYPQTAEIPDDLTMFQPRLSAAWDLTGQGRTVVRASAGIFNARTPANLLQRVFSDNGITTVAVDSRIDTTLLSQLTFPNAYPGLAAGVRIGPQRIFGFDPNFQNPETTGLSATVEHRVAEALQVSAGYIRNRTIHLQRRLDRNLFPPTIADTGMPVFPSTRPDPTIAQLEINESTARSQYDALVLSGNGRMGRMQWQMGYTFAKNWDDDSNERNFSRQPTLNPFNLADEWAPSKQDVRHNFTANAITVLPGGVTLSGILLARSGLPYTAVIGSDQQRDANDDNDRAIINGRVVPRHSFRQPGFFNLDLRLMKQVRLRGQSSLALLVDVLNATRAKNLNFGNDGISVFGTPASPVATAGRPLFAPSTARFGGPRQIQLGARLMF